MGAFTQKEASARALETRLRELSKNARNFYDQPVRQLRARLRDAYADVLLEDPKMAQAHEIETALWKWVFYKPIEEFRHRVRFAAEAGERGEEPLRKVKAALVTFLEEATSFYLQLIARLQAAHGDAGLRVGDGHSITLRADQPSVHDRSPAVVSIYRCLICLGDLIRYQTNIPSAKSAKDWSKAEQFYRTAARVHPSGGNAHNQLAVLATYRNDELSAVYHYVRSLAVAEPFLIARENLLLLFEQNRKRLEGRSSSVASARPLAERHYPPPRMQGNKADDELDALLTRFVRLQGILFTKINLDTYGAVYDDAFADLAAALENASMLHALVAPGRHDSESALLKLTVMIVFSLHEANNDPTVVHARYADELQQGEVLRYAIMTACSLAAQLLRRLVVAGTIAAEQQRQDLMAPLQILLSWLADRGADGVGDPKDAKELSAHRQFWSAAEEYVKWSCHGAAQQVHAAAQQVQTALGPIVSEDLQLTGFIPLEQGHSSPDSSPSYEQAGSTQRAVRIVRALLRCQPAADRCSVLSGGDSDRSALVAAAQLFSAACYDVVSTVGGADLGVEQPAEPAAQPDVGLEALDCEDRGDGAEMEPEEVIVYAPPAVVPQSARVPPQRLPAAGLGTASAARQPIMAGSEPTAQTDSLQINAAVVDAHPPGGADVHMAQQQADSLPGRDAESVGQPDANMLGGEGSKARAPAAQPPDRPHGMLGWDLFENARASTGFSAFFGGNSAGFVEGARQEDSQAHARQKAPEGISEGQDWSWLDDMAGQS